MTSQSKFSKSFSSRLESWKIILAHFGEKKFTLGSLASYLLSLFLDLDALSLKYDNKMGFSHW